MGTKQTERLAGAELGTLFDRLFPHGLAGADVLAEVAPEGWERSPLLACFHPSVERLFDETLQIHRNIEALRRARSAHDDGPKADDSCEPEPTLDEVGREYQAQPVQQDVEVTEVVGQCLWDVFSDNHEVIISDGRAAHIGSFRAASAFLDRYLSDTHGGTWREGDCMRFYMGTIWIAGRADLTPVYAMIFSRLRSIGADWIYHFPELHLVDFSSLRADAEALAAERRVHEHEAEIAGLRAELAEMNASAREDAMDRPPPALVQAYRRIYGRDPRGWPPA
ncbi:MAG: hypothetical protein GEV06_21065 [Luteitalea sp.]|nr:hypothetical protein [Luteitalea sp.]